MEEEWNDEKEVVNNFLREMGIDPDRLEDIIPDYRRDRQSKEDDKKDVKFHASDSNDSDGSSGISNTDFDKSEEKVDEERLVDWAYQVMDWLKIAIDAKAWDKIQEHAEDIVTAFLVLVKDEHRGIVMDVLRKFREVVV